MNLNPNKRYAREFSAAMVAYVVAVVCSLTALRAVGDGSAWRYPLALLPVLPGIAALTAVVRRLRTMDEMQRRIQSEAFGITLAVTLLSTFSYGFLENAGLPRLSLVWVAPAIVATWGTASAVVSRRYA